MANVSLSLSVINCKEIKHANKRQKRAEWIKNMIRCMLSARDSLFLSLDQQVESGRKEKDPMQTVMKGELGWLRPY